MNIPLVLKFLGFTQYNLGRGLNHTPPVGGYVNHDETEFNATTKIDNPPGLNWALCVARMTAAENWQANLMEHVEAVPGIASDVAAAESAISTIEGNVTTIQSDMATMASDMAAVQGAMMDEAAVDAKMAAIIGMPPSELNTLQEIASAIQSGQSEDEAIITALDGKVDKVTGKGLSTNDYTTTDKDKVALLTPRAHIADAATNAPTNLNVVTTLLGALVGQVNDTNTKQNDLAAKFNTLLDRLEAAGLLATS